MPSTLAVLEEDSRGRADTRGYPVIRHLESDNKSNNEKRAFFRTAKSRLLSCGVAERGSD